MVGGTALVLLAAGRGARFGGGKLEADYRGKPLWRWATEAAEAAPFARRIVVYAPDCAWVAALSGWQTVANRDADEGMASSIRCGVAAAGEADRIVIALADMPHITAAHLAALAQGDGVIFTKYPGGRPGSPAAFPRAAFARLGSLHGDVGAASLDWPEATLIEPASADALVDIDRRDQLGSGVPN